MISGCAKSLTTSAKAVWAATTVRALSLHEYHAMNLLKKYGVQVPKFAVATTPDEVVKAADEVLNATKTKDLVVKAQVLAGGRGKGRFESGLQGGVQKVKSVAEACDKAKQMLGSKLITKQTGERGRICEAVLVVECLNLKKEYYFSITLDRNSNGPVLIGSSRGGVNIEEVAKETPDAIVKLPVNMKGLQSEDLQRFVEQMGFDADHQKQAKDQIMKLYELFTTKDATLLEINPLAEDDKGNVICMDCKLVVDDSADFRQKELFALKDTHQEDPLDVRAEAAHLNFIRLDGSIGCLVNGAGLAMATMDIIKLHGGAPANFLDVGGGATAEQVTEALRIITSEPRVSSILVNIFGGIMRCDVIAHGIIEAARELQLKVPIVVRLLGTNMEEAKSLIATAQGLTLVPCDDLDSAAETVVKLSKIVDLSKTVPAGVKFKLDI